MVAFYSRPNLLSTVRTYVSFIFRNNHARA